MEIVSFVEFMGISTVMVSFFREQYGLSDGIQTVYVNVSYFDMGTHYCIDSGSLEPNDQADIEYTVYDDKACSVVTDSNVVEAIEDDLTKLLIDALEKEM